MPTITIPLLQPRLYQVPILKAVDGGIKRCFCLWHRRAGKDLVLWNLIIKKAVEKTGLYYYLLPTYTQAKKIIWDGITNDGRRFLDYVPKEIIIGQPNASEMKIGLKNGSLIQLIGTDNYDAVRGSNPMGCIFSEFAYQNPMAWEVIKPILKANGGWAVFNTTPNGQNFAFEIYEMAKQNPNWFTEKLTIEDTGILTRQDIAQERAEGMSEEMIQQEYYCSFVMGAQGAFYANLVNDAEQQNRICPVTYEPNIPIDLWLDLGRNDTTAILFEQTIGNEIRIVDTFEANGQAVVYYVKQLDSKPYRYGTMHLPHDAVYDLLASEKNIQQQFEEAGFKTDIVPKLGIDHGIQQVRKIFPRLWFDKERCRDFLRAIRNYHKEWDEVAKVFKNHPKHDWSSNYSDSLRYLAVGHEDRLTATSKVTSTQFDRYDPF